MDQLLQHSLNALILGGTYALLGIGLTLIFGIMRVVNFAHGELYAFGAYMMYLWVMVAGANFYLALPLAVVLGVALGALIELILLRRLQGADIDTTMLVMIGAWIALQNMEQLIWSGVAKSINSPFPSAPLVLGSVSVSWNRLFVFVVALALIAASYALINRTRMGKAMRATFQDRETAALMGVDIRWISYGHLRPGLRARRGGRRAARPRIRGLPDHGRSRLAQGVRHRHPRRARQHPRRHHRRVHPRLHGGAGRRLRLLRLSRRHGLPADHRHPADQADRPVRAEGAHRVKRALTIAWLLLLASVPLWLDNLYVLHVLIMTGIFIIAAMSLNLLLGYTGQLSLGHVAFFGIGAYTSSLVSLGFSVHLLPGWEVTLDPKPVWLGMLLRHGAGGIVRLGDRPHLLQGARRLLRHRHGQLRRGNPARRAQLGGADTGPDGAQQHPLSQAGRSRAASRSPSSESRPTTIWCSPSRVVSYILIRRLVQLARRPRHDRAAARTSRSRPPSAST